MEVRNSEGMIGLVPRTYVGPIQEMNTVDTFTVRVLYEFKSEDDTTYMTVEPDMIITVDEEKDGWYHGYTEDKRSGYFPVSYAERM